MKVTLGAVATWNDTPVIYVELRIAMLKQSAETRKNKQKAATKETGR